MQENNETIVTELTDEEITVDLSEQNRIRIEKLTELKGAEMNPYEITKFPVTDKNADIAANFESYENKDVCIAGRIMSWRDMGKANFIDIRDASGRMQIYVKTDEIGEENFKNFKKYWDLGDIAGVKGFVFRTKRGEISVHAKEIILLSKSLLPLPEKWHGLRDKEERYRKRYLDLIANPDVKDVFVTRSRIIGEIRKYLDGLGFIEVDTPVLHTVEIGAAARPFITHHNT
ncbi:MAG: OB-fold nucleic acid binding domain-containing protein, partial [Oscillospiraceae bacterium]|nr:OB-fold nucleic acid binding domain-containing protein [Oscillospiraceae bacterium]